MSSELPPDFRPMTEEELRAAVAGRPSVLLQQRPGLDAVFETISQRKCPKCGGGLVPRTPSEVGEVFSGSKTNFSSWCPACRATAPFPFLAG